MAVGVSAATAANMLNVVGDPYIQMHFGDPGDDGTSNVALLPTRVLTDLSTPTAATRTLVAAVQWPQVWSAAAQTVTHLSAWSAATGGTFLFSVALSAQVPFVAGMIPRLTALSLTVPGIAAD